MSWYPWLIAIATFLVLFDALRRRLRESAILWSIGTLVLGPIVLPLYFARRPLRAGEVREGGTAWNVLKNFALFWTVLMLVAATATTVSAGILSARDLSGVAPIFAAAATLLSLGILGAIWFFPMVGALLLGQFLKQSSVIERGPTGRLTETPETSASDSPIGVATLGRSVPQSSGPTVDAEHVGGMLSEDELASFHLTKLRSGTPADRIKSRAALSEIFERRGMLEEAVELLEHNVRSGVRGREVYRRMASIYRRLGRDDDADAALTEAIISR